MGVNKNIEDLKKELADMHRLFDNIISDKKENTKNKIKINPEKNNENTEQKKEVFAKTETPNSNITKENIKENITDEKVLTESSTNIKESTEITLEEEITIVDQTEPTSNTSNSSDEILEKEMDKSMINETEILNTTNSKTESEELSDIMISFDSPSESIKEKDSKVIDLHTKEQYLSIREKLERIKNEIKQKELELKKKKK